MITHAQNPLLEKWRRHIARRDRLTNVRPLAAVGYLAHGPTTDGFVELKSFVLVLLADAPKRNGTYWPRLMGIGGSLVPWGVRWGGRRQNKFLKNLHLKPSPGACGRRIDADDTELLGLALNLDQALERHLENRWLPVRRSLQLPKMWAGFRRDDVKNIAGDGPELAARSSRSRVSSSGLLERAKRKHSGLILFPLEWVSHRWQRAAGFFVDIRRFPKRQTFVLRSPQSDSLCGYQGAMEFNFVASRFNGHRRPRRRSSSTRG